MKLSHRQDVLDTWWNSKGYFETDLDAEGFTIKRYSKVTLQEVNGMISIFQTSQEQRSLHFTLQYHRHHQHRFEVS